MRMSAPILAVIASVAAGIFYSPTGTSRPGKQGPTSPEGKGTAERADRRFEKAD